MNRTTLLTLLSLLLSGSLYAQQEIILSNLSGRSSSALQGSSFGVPFPRGSVFPGDTFTLEGSGHQSLGADTYPLAYWSDGSLKWLGVAGVFPSTSEGSTLSLKVSPAPKKTRKSAPVPAGSIARQTPDGIEVNTGAMTCLFPSKGSSLIASMTIGGTQAVEAARSIMVLQKRNGAAIEEEQFTGQITSLSLLRSGEQSAVIKVEGIHKGEKSLREWLPFSLYCTVYKGLPTVSMTYSFIFDSDGREDFIKALGLRLQVPFRDEVHNRHVRFAGDGKDGAGFWCQPVRLAPGYRPSAGRVFFDNYQSYLQGAKLPACSELSASELAALSTCPVWADMRLRQDNPNSFSIDKRTSGQSSWVHVTDGGRSLGGALLGDSSSSVYIGIKDFYQSYPASLEVSSADAESGNLTAWLWSPSAECMDMRHYDTVGHDLKINYEDYKEGWESPYGVGHRSSLELRLFDGIPSCEDLLPVARATQKGVQYVCSPDYYYKVKAFGTYWGLPDTERFGFIEDQLTSTLDFYKAQVDQRSWYGFWNYGDVMHNYDFTRHDWRYDIGGWAWNNIELAPNVLLWTCFLRTGREDYWTMAEAMEKHSSEVDVHHIGRFAPLGSRHNVTHWGDGCKQPRIEYAAMKRYMYYLTGGDALTGDLMSEQLGAEKAYDYARRVSTWGAVDGTYLKSSLNDWAYYASNWMLQYERTLDPYWMERLLDSMKDIVALGSFSGRLAFDYFDPESGRFMVYLKEDTSPSEAKYAPVSDYAPAASLSPRKLKSLVGERLSRVRGDTFSTLFGAPEIMTEMRLSFPYEQFWTLADNSFRDVSSSKGGNMTGPRMAAWVAASCSDAVMGELAWKNLLANGETQTESDGTPVQEHNGSIATPYIIKSVDEPYFLGKEAGWQRHTPSTTQWLINAIEVMEWAGPYFENFSKNY